MTLLFDFLQWIVRPISLNGLLIQTMLYYIMAAVLLMLNRNDNGFIPYHNICTSIRVHAIYELAGPTQRTCSKLASQNWLNIIQVNIFSICKGFVWTYVNVASRTKHQNTFSRTVQRCQHDRPFGRSPPHLRQNCGGQSRTCKKMSIFVQSHSLMTKIWTQKKKNCRNNTFTSIHHTSYQD